MPEQVEMSWGVGGAGKTWKVVAREEESGSG